MWGGRRDAAYCRSLSHGEAGGDFSGTVVSAWPCLGPEVIVTSRLRRTWRSASAHSTAADSEHRKRLSNTEIKLTGVLGNTWVEKGRGAFRAGVGNRTRAGEGGVRRRHPYRQCGTEVAVCVGRAREAGGSLLRVRTSPGKRKGKIPGGDGPKRSRPSLRSANSALGRQQRGEPRRQTHHFPPRTTLRSHEACPPPHPVFPHLSFGSSRGDTLEIRLPCTLFVRWSASLAALGASSVQDRRWVRGSGTGSGGGWRRHLWSKTGE